MRRPSRRAASHEESLPLMTATPPETYRKRRRRRLSISCGLTILRRYMRVAHNWFAVELIMLLILLWNLSLIGNSGSKWRNLNQQQQDEDIVAFLAASLVGDGRIYSPPFYSRVAENRLDYGGLHIQMLQEGEDRTIRRDESLEEGGYVEVDPSPTDDYTDKDKCRPVAWYHDVYSNCNTFHEFDLSSSVLNLDAFIRGLTTYRQVYRADLLFESVILKTASFWQLFDTDFDELLEHYSKDTLLSQIVSANPSFVDTYATCGMAIMSEAMSHGDLVQYAVPQYRRGVDLSERFGPTDLVSMNKVDPRFKLILSLQMAEPIAFMHNYRGGVIVHDDIHLGQYLFTMNPFKGLDPNQQLIKLIDFDDSEILEWNDGKQEYCKYMDDGPRSGDWRAPEQFLNQPLDEMIDIYALGLNMYAMLTGTWNFLEIKDDETVQEMVLAGKKPFVDPRYRERSFAERKLADIMELCWEFDPAKRIDSGALVKLLREAVEENERQLGEDGLR